MLSCSMDLDLDDVAGARVSFQVYVMKHLPKS